jgi:hypothetical protein
MSLVDGNPLGTPPETGQAPSGTSGSEQTFTVNVNGEEQQVTLAELQSGYLRQADYTRKTTDVANMRKQLESAQVMQEALERNPTQAIETIASHYGVPLGAPPVVAPPALSAPPQFDEFGDPIPVPPQRQEDPVVAELLAEVKDLRSQISGVATSQHATRLDTELTELESRFDGVDRNMILRHMQANNISSPELAFRDLHWEEAQAALQGQRERQQAEERILDQKRQTQGLVNAGPGVSAGATTAPPKDYSGKGLTAALYEAFEDSKQELGIENISQVRFND